LFLLLKQGEKMELEKLKEEQRKLAKKLISKDDFSDITKIAGCEILFTSDEIIAIVVMLDAKSLKLIDKRFSVSKPKIPYIPLFQSYREVPVVIEALNLLTERPDMIIYDGCGILHPAKLGPASHLGLILDLPTIGVAKKRSFGELKEGYVYVDGEKRGVELKTKEFAKPLCISPGHKISLQTAERIVRDCLKEGSKLPEPLRIAHNFGVFIKKNLHHRQQLEQGLEQLKEDFPETESL
jgi:deoxyribonuclease V